MFAVLWTPCVWRELPTQGAYTANAIEQHWALLKRYDLNYQPLRSVAELSIMLVGDLRHPATWTSSVSALSVNQDLSGEYTSQPLLCWSLPDVHVLVGLVQRWEFAGQRVDINSAVRHRMQRAKSAMRSLFETQASDQDIYDGTNMEVHALPRGFCAKVRES